MVVVGPSPISGKGAFASQEITRGQVLECDVVPLATADPDLQVYLFPYRGSLTCIHLGFASFLNSSTEPNLVHIGIDLQLNVSRFRALRDIEPGEELTLAYGILSSKDK